LSIFETIVAGVIVGLVLMAVGGFLKWFSNYYNEVLIEPNSQSFINLRASVDQGTLFSALYDNGRVIVKSCV
jgi:uncharacterized membrane protein